MTRPLREVVHDQLWVKEHPVRLAGGMFLTRMTVHRASRTLIAVDLVENFRNETPGTNAILRAWMHIFGMWGRPRPAPELRLFTRDRKAARAALERLLAWDFDRAVIAHGELLDHQPKAAIREAWQWVATRELCRDEPVRRGPHSSSAPVEASTKAPVQMDATRAPRRMAA